MGKYSDAARTTPPREFSENIQLAVQSGVDNLQPHVASFETSCKCGGSLFLFSQVQKDDPEFKEYISSPLSVRCSKCDLDSEIFDEKRHGYDGRNGHNDYLESSSVRTEVLCRSCKSPIILARVDFYFNFDESEWDEMSEIADERSCAVAELYDWIQFTVTCPRCSISHSDYGFECA